MEILAAPAPLKGVLSAVEAARALAEGVRAAGGEAVELPVADGGEGTADALASVHGGSRHEAPVHDPLGRPVVAWWLLLRDGTAVVEAAAAIGLPLVGEGERDPLRASSRGLGELVAAALDARPRELVVCLGGTATVDGGAGLREVVRELPVPTRAVCDVTSPLLGPRGAAHAFGPQKGASADQVEELERRLAADESLARWADVPGAGAAGGLGAALASLGAELVRGAPFVLDALGFDRAAARADLVVTGEGTVDRTTLAGKAPGEVVARCTAAGVPVALFGGRIAEEVPGAELHALSGAPERARDDLRALGWRLASSASAARFRAIQSAEATCSSRSSSRIRSSAPCFVVRFTIGSTWRNGTQP